MFNKNCCCIRRYKYFLLLGFLLPVPASPYLLLFCSRLCYSILSQSQRLEQWLRKRGSSMDAAAQFLHCDINCVRRPLGSGVPGEHMRVRRRAFPSRFRVRRSGVVAVATEPKPGTTLASSPGKSRVPPNGSINGATNRFGNVSDEIKRVRAQMEEDEQLATLMRGLRGQNLSDSQFADENIRLRLVERMKKSFVRAKLVLHGAHIGPCISPYQQKHGELELSSLCTFS